MGTYIDELGEGYLSVEVLVGLNDRPVDQLLQLHVVQVVANHHLEHGEQLAVRNVAVIVDVVDLEGEAQFFFLTGTRRETVEALHELEEADVAVLVLVEYGDHSLDQRVLRQLGDVEELLGLEGARLVLVDLLEVLVELLQFLLGD